MPKATIKRAKDRTPQERNAGVYKPKWDRQKAMDYICARLEEGGAALAVILADLSPEVLATFVVDGSTPERLTYENIVRWRRESEALQAQLDEAFNIGNDRMAMRARKTARGLKADKGGDSSGNVERDKVIIATDFRLLEFWDRRYQRRMLHSNDPNNPLPAPVFIIQPVMPAPLLLEHDPIEPIDPAEPTDE